VGVFVIAGGAALRTMDKPQRMISADLYALQAIPVVNGRLFEARPGYVFLAGDSHAELVNPTYRLCGREIVNGGVSGAGAELYRDLLKRIEFRRPPDVAVLTIGTNDILRKKDPLSPARIAAFESNVAQILKALPTQMQRVFVTPLPPVGRELAGKVQIEAVAAYSDRLRKLCEQERCIFVDPFRSSREDDGSTARPGAMRDGLHLASYRDAYTRLAGEICPGGTF
jgi:lysophospholipase L1-like esterase